jgi:DNA-binding winged helix-turn-helix (wHTH) protein
MTIQLISPFPQKTFDNFLLRWTKIINKNECCSILHLSKRDQLYRIKQIQNNQENLKKYIHNFDITTILFLDITTEAIEDKIDLENYLKNINILSGKKIVLFVVDADQLLDEKSYLLSAINSLYQRFSQISIFYLFQRNISLPRYTIKYSLFNTLYQNIEIFPLFSPNDSRYFFKQLGERFQTTYPPYIIDEIVHQCGGYFWLIKQAARYYAQNHERKNILGNEGIQLRLRILYNEFHEEERHVLQKIVTRDFLFNKQEKQIIEYFIKTRHLNQTKTGYILTVPIFEKYIKEQIEKRAIFTINEKEELILNHIPIDSLFSKRENSVLKYFLKNINITLSRESIAKTIWQQLFEQEYTDWALDQFIKRLRLKLSKLGLHPHLITTKKNQGYIFNQ